MTTISLTLSALILMSCGSPPPTTSSPPASVATSACGATSSCGAVLTINGARPKPSELARLAAATGHSPDAGEYWYDARSGLAGHRGSYAQWWVGPGYDFGPLVANASNGDTAIFYNERELPRAEAAFVAWLFDIPASAIPSFAGHYALEATGDVYALDTNGRAIAWLGNLLSQAQRKAAKSIGQDGPWQTSDGSAGNFGGGCIYVSIPAADGANFTSGDSGCG